MAFQRTYTITITEPGCAPRVYSFDDPNKMSAFSREKYAEQRNGQLSDETTIRSKTSEDSIAGAIYAELSDIGYEDFHTCEEYESEFQDETDDEGEPTLSPWAIESLVDHVCRLNSFHHGMQELDYLKEVLKGHKYTYKTHGTYFLQEREYQRYNPTEVGTLNFEDRSRLFILNPYNSEKQEQAFEASLIFWYEGKYHL